MKVAYIASRYPAVSHTFILREVQGLRGAGIEADPFTIRRVPGNELLSDDDRAENNRTHAILPVGPLRLIGAHFLMAFRGGRHYFAALGEAVWRRPPGLRSLVWQMFYFAEAGVLAAELRRRGIEHVHAHFANVAANVAKLAARITNIRWSMTLHGLSDFGDPTTSFLKDKIGSAAFVICVSDFGRAQAMLQSELRHWDKIHRVYCGVDPRRFPMPAERNDAGPTGRVRLLTVARLGHEKGLSFLLEAIPAIVAQGVEVVCTLVGDGPERTRLQEIASGLGISDRVRFAGAVGQHEIQKYYEEADVFVLPSLSEGLPVVLMEAMAKGLPVIATRIAGIPELVEEGVSGLLVSPGCTAPLVQAIVELANNSQRRSQLAQAGRERVERSFDANEGYLRLACIFEQSRMTQQTAVGLGCDRKPPHPTLSPSGGEGIQDAPVSHSPQSRPTPASDQAKSRRYVVVTPVRDEAAYLQRTIDSMIAQTTRPTQWIIVDDGSRDDTVAIAQAAAAKHEWIRVHIRADRGTRQVGGGVVEAFNEGLSLVDPDDYAYVCKLDGDLEFGPTYFERLFKHFEDDPRLGTASGKSWIRAGDRLVPERTGDEFSQGQSKLYRTACYRDIGGFVSEVMWDGIDCHRCRMRGWVARSFRDEELRFLHLRPMGSSFKNIFHGRMRWGKGQYFMGTHPLYALAITIYRMFERPFILGGVCILLGYLSAYGRGMRRYEDPDFRRYLRHWQLSKLLPL